jgi:hypothetical protein
LICRFLATIMATIEEQIATVLDPTAASFRRRMAVADLIRSDTPQAWQALEQVLSDDDRYLRREVVSSLCRLRDARAADALLTALQDQDDTIRRDAIEGLAKIADARAIEPLQALAAEGSYSIREAARRTLDEFQRLGIGSPMESTAAAEPATPEPVPPEATADRSAPPEHALPPAALNESVPPAPVAAEVVQTEPPPSASVAPEPIPSPPTRPQPTSPSEIKPVEISLPERFDWQRAVRMRILLGDQVAELAPWYEQLTRQRQQLLAVEEQYQQAWMELGLVRADKEDDLSRCEASLQAARNELARLDQSATRVERERTLLMAESRSVWNQFLNAFHAERNEKTRESMVQTEENLRALREQIATVRQQVTRFEQQYDQLAQPVKQSQSRYEELTGQRDGAAQQVGETDDRIDRCFLDLLLSFPPDERESRLRQCGRLSRDPDFFDICSGPLMRALNELRSVRAKLETAEQQQRESVSAAQHSLEGLAETITAGFYVGNAPRKTTIRLQGSLRVSESHGLFEGYAGADGWAAGTGSCEADYTIEEIAWTPPDDLPGAVDRFADSWMESGQLAARHRHLAAMAEAGERTVAEFIRFLRSELERDFEEARS